MRYLIWSGGNPQSVYMAYVNAQGDWEGCFDIEDFWHEMDSPDISENVVLTGRFVTLDHEPSPAEVRKLLEGPDPLGECLDLVKRLAWAGSSSSFMTAKGEAEAILAKHGRQP